MAVTEVTIMKRTVLAFLALSFPILLSVGSRHASANEAPEVRDSFASNVIRPGTSWRVYLRANDIDGDMRTIVAVLSGAGFGSPQTSITQLRKEHRQEFAGYIFLRTPRDRSMLNKSFSLQVFVRDSKELKSETVEFPLSFDYKDPQKLPAKWQDVSENKLGAIMIEITGERDRMRGGGDF